MGDQTIIRTPTTPALALERLANEGYDVTLSVTRKGRHRMPRRPEDIEVGRGKAWYCAISYSNNVTDFVTGYGDLASEAIEAAEAKLWQQGIKPDFGA